MRVCNPLSLPPSLSGILRLYIVLLHILMTPKLAQSLSSPRPSSSSSSSFSSSSTTQPSKSIIINRRNTIKNCFLLTSTPLILTSGPIQNANSLQVGVGLEGVGSIQGTGGSITRVEGIGGGFDLMNSATSKGVDVIYPSSMEGKWKCRRTVTSIEGDVGQAEIAWRNLGGVGGTMLNHIETFETKFVRPNDELDIKNEYMFEGEMYKGVILDRGHELKSRLHDNDEYQIAWSLESPDILTYYNNKKENGGEGSSNNNNNNNNSVEIAVVQRKVELPNEKGFGYDELYRITSSAGGIFGNNRVQRAVRVKRRYRRDIDDDGNRIVEGLEIMKTYRVLDGVAGVEMPTSTTKSMLKLRRL